VTPEGEKRTPISPITEGGKGTTAFKTAFATIKSSVWRRGVLAWCEGLKRKDNRIIGRKEDLKKGETFTRRPERRKESGGVGMRTRSAGPLACVCPRGAIGQVGQEIGVAHGPGKDASTGGLLTS